MSVNHCFHIKKPRVIFELFDDEIVLINLENGNYYSINGVAAEIWSLIDNSIPSAGIIENILSRYTGVPAEISRAISQFLDELAKEGLIEASEGEKEAATEKTDQRPTAQASSELRPFIAPELNRYTDMQDLLLLDPIHEVSEQGWPNPKSDAAPQKE